MGPYELSGNLAALALEGPKAVGKTASASQRASTVYPLDDPEQRAVALADPARLTQGDPPILVDEWQYVPESWDLVRRAVDAGVPPGQFLLTGSASPPSTSTHSGAGRIVTVRMRPLTLFERGIASPTVRLGELVAGTRPAIRGQTEVTLADYAEEIIRSGFPGLRGLSGRALRAQLDGYLARIVERDFPEMGHRVRNPAALRRWMAAYAAGDRTVPQPPRAALDRGPGSRVAADTKPDLPAFSATEAPARRPGPRRATAGSGCRRAPRCNPGRPARAARRNAPRSAVRIVGDAGCPRLRAGSRSGREALPAPGPASARSI